MRPSTIISGLLVLVGLTVTSAHYLDDDIYARDIDNIYARDIDADYLKGIYARGFEDGMTEAGLKKRKQPKLIPMACNSCGHHADDTPVHAEKGICPKCKRHTWRQNLGVAGH